MLSISYSEDVFSITETADPDFGRVSHLWSKEEFETMAGVSTAPYEKIIYEPARPSYLVVMANDPFTIQSFEAPTEHPALNWIANHEVDLLAEAKATYAAALDYVLDQGVWKPRRETLTLEDLRSEIHSDLNQIAFTASQTILGLQALATQQGRDISTAVNSRITQLLNWLSARRLQIDALSTTQELLSYEIPELDAQQQSDIDQLMNLL